MARKRVKAAARKIAERQAARQLTEAQEVARGVLAVCQEITPHVKPGSLYWTGPLQYVVEQMGPRVCRAHGLSPDRAADVSGYLLAAMNEYVVSLVGEFDPEHFEAWTVAAAAREVG